MISMLRVPISVGGSSGYKLNIGGTKHHILTGVIPEKLYLYLLGCGIIGGCAVSGRFHKPREAFRSEFVRIIMGGMGAGCKDII